MHAGGKGESKKMMEQEIGQAPFTPASPPAQDFAVVMEGKGKKIAVGWR